MQQQPQVYTQQGYSGYSGDATGKHAKGAGGGCCQPHVANQFLWANNRGGDVGKIDPLVLQQSDDDLVNAMFHNKFALACGKLLLCFFLIACGLVASNKWIDASKFDCFYQVTSCSYMVEGVPTCGHFEAAQPEQKLDGWSIALIPALALVPLLGLWIYYTITVPLRTFFVHTRLCPGNRLVSALEVFGLEVLDLHFTLTGLMIFLMLAVLNLMNTTDIEWYLTLLALEIAIFSGAVTNMYDAFTLPSKQQQQSQPLLQQNGRSNNIIAAGFRAVAGQFSKHPQQGGGWRESPQQSRY